MLFEADEVVLERAALAAAPPLLGVAAATGTLTWQDAGYAVVRVLFATDRAESPAAGPAARFGSDRAGLSYGTCDVSIPRDHRMGRMESPSIWRFQFREDPAKHVVLLTVEVEERDAFFGALSHRVAAAESPQAFLFVHGYKVTFEDAARRAAQLSYDLGFRGVPMFYSWPSRGELASYTTDENTVEWAQSNLERFLEDLLERVDRLHLIAHSMGNRPLARALVALLARRPELRARLREIVLTAPDIDAEVFRRDLAPALGSPARPATLYASSEDVALAASRRIHGAPRAGDSGRGLVVADGIETVDATAVDTSLLGHSYFGEARSVVSDLFYLMGRGLRARDRFGLREVQSAEGSHWVFDR
ncbi:MAG: alpha/beta hydrolase [Acidobacteria bacterium]|nr:MAG: alpha/beta hydrolase [Acidobacteriota bacterium]REK09541.1 MAG: alpha/beta hydrolase [Acidobacteriota bacterium]